MSETRRTGGTYVLGKTRMGKSTLLLDMILADITAGEGVCVLDAHGDLIRDLCDRIPDHRRYDVILLDLMEGALPFGLNPFRCSDPQEPVAVAKTVARVMQIFERLWGLGSQNSSWGPRLEQFLRNTALVLAHHNLTMAEAVLFLTDQDVRKHLVRTVPNAQVRLFWETYERLTERVKLERIESTHNKLDAFLTNPLTFNIVGQEEDTVDWRRAMDTGQIILVKLDAQLPDVSSLLGSVIAGRILEAAFTREELPVSDRKRFCLYADEYHRFATEDFAGLLVEAGKFGIETTVAHQFRGQLVGRNQGATLNVGNFYVFQVSGEDAQELAGNFTATPPEPELSGWDPVRVPCGDPVHRLLTTGHRNRQVVAMAEGLLRQMSNDAARAKQDEYNAERERRFPITLGKDVPGPWHDKTGVYDSLLGTLQSHSHRWARSQDVDTALSTINDALAKAMRGAWEDELATAFITAIWQLRGYLALYQAPHDLRDAPKREAVTALFVMDLDDPREPAFLHACKRLLREWLKTNLGKETYIRYPGDGKPAEAISLAECHERFDQFAEAAIQPALEMWRYLWALSDALKDDPILVDSGQVTPRYHTPRTYGDVSDQVANELATLPRFHMRIREGTQEREALIEPLPNVPRRHLQPAGTDRRFVERVIQARHERLRRDGDEGAVRRPEPTPLAPEGRVMVVREQGQAQVMREQAFPPPGRVLPPSRPLASD